MALLAALVAAPAPASATQIVTVSTLNDSTSSGNGCSLREAIVNFNDQAQTYSDCAAGSGSTMIRFSVSGTITLGSELPTVTNTNWELSIDGGFASGGGAGITIDAQNCIQHEFAAPTCFRHFHVGSGAALSLQNLNLINGHAPDGAGGEGSGTDGENGGSILNDGYLALANVDISHSQAGDGGAALNGSPGAGGNGGAIYNSSSSARIDGTGVTLDHNRAGESGVNGGTTTRYLAARGGAIYNAAGNVSLTNATLAYNSIPFTLDAHRGGAAIYTDGGTVRMSFSTFAGNTISTSGVGEGFGIYAIDGAAVSFENTIVDDIPQTTTGHDDCFTGFSDETKGAISDQGYNLENASSCGFTATGSAQNIDPQLQGGSGAPVLQDNLGSNQTIALEPTSPAIDRIPDGTNGCGGPLTYDERGFDRPWPALGSCDVGAFEAHPLPQNITFALPPIQANYGSSFNIDPTSDSGLQVSVSAIGPCAAKSDSGGGYDISMTAGTGTCTLTASQAGSLLYLAADSVVQTVNAAPAPLTVIADDKASAYGGSTPTFTVSYLGFVGKDGPSSLDGALAFSFAGTSGTSYGPSSIPPTAAGTYTISPSGYSSDNYSISYGAGIYTIGKSDQMIDVTTPAPSSAQYDTQFTVVATGGGSTQPVTYASSGVCTNSGPAFTMTSGTGTCTVTIDQAGDGNYNDAPELTESVTATQAPQSVQFTSTPPSQPVYGDAYQPAATGGASGNPVLLSTSGACSYNAGTVTMTSSGVCTVAANQFGDPDYQDAPEQDQRFIVGLKPATLKYAGSQFWSTGSATASSANVSLSGTVTPDAGGNVDLTQAPVTFLLYNSSNTAMTTPDATCVATVRSSGQATCVSSLAPDNWTVVMRMSPNSYFTAPDSAAAVVTVYVPLASPALSALAPSSGVAGTSIAASSISGSLSGGSSPSGVITFRVFGPQSSPPGDCSAGTAVGTASVSGNGSYSPSAGFTPSSAGDYWWYASYGGDASNNTATSACGSGMAKTTVGNASLALSALAPVARIASPASGRVYVRGQRVESTFGCSEGVGGPGITSCTDSGDAAAPHGRLDTSTVGQHTYTVTASSGDGQSATASITYTVGRAVPRLSRLELTPDRFLAAGRGPAIANVLDTGTTIKYLDSLAGRATFRVMRCAEAHGSCRKLVFVGSFSDRASKGLNRVRFTGRLRGHALNPGRYVLHLAATTGGRRGRTATAHFTILTPPSTCTDTDHDGDCDTLGGDLAPSSATN